MAVFTAWERRAGAVEYTGSSLRDPFINLLEKERKTRLSDLIKRPPDVGSEGQGSYVLQGIVWNPKRPQAIISGHVLEIGGAVGSAKVVRIEKDRVALLVNDEEIRLKVSHN